MSRFAIVGLSCVLTLVLGGCRSKYDNIVSTYPELDLSASRLSFDDVAWGESRTRQVVIQNRGELPMGISELALTEDEMEENFSISYDRSAIVCPGDEVAGARVLLDTNNPSDDTGGDDTAAEDDSDSDQGSMLILEPRCKLTVDITLTPVTVGKIYSSLTIRTATQAEGEYTGYPNYYRDPDNTWRTVMLEGEGTKGTGNLIVTPRSLDMGHVWLGQTLVDYVKLSNVGTGDVTLGLPTLDPSCTTGFSISDSFEDGHVLAGGDSTLVEISYSPVDRDPAYCDLLLTSDDEDAGSVSISLQSNVGSNPENVPPTVSIRTPKVGYQHLTADPLKIKLNIFDANQPADTLVCKIKSAVLQKASLASCTPTDASGYVEIEIPLKDLDDGVDTLLVTVTDDSEKSAYASTTILYQTGFPDGDDDGDGYDETPDEDGNYDCDDADINTYPAAAELYDGADNDCDGLIDEGTIGDDFDGDSVSPVNGDCDDSDDETYPGAPESPDQKDNDCDGVVDEGTSLYDDDGDGFAEVANDCNDKDPDINPAAVEYCDGIDNDCNGLKDTQDGCIATDSDPLIIGGIQMGVTALGGGESTTMSVFAFDADGQALTYSWSQDPDLSAQAYNSIDNPTASSVTFTAPTLEASDPGKIYSVYVVVQDPDGHQDWSPSEITVYPDPVELDQSRIVENGGCSKSEDTSAAALLPLLPALAGLFLARRRRED